MKNGLTLLALILLLSGCGEIAQPGTPVRGANDPAAGAVTELQSLNWQIGATMAEGPLARAWVKPGSPWVFLAKRKLVDLPLPTMLLRVNVRTGDAEFVMPNGLPKSWSWQLAVPLPNDDRILVASRGVGIGLVEPAEVENAAPTFRLISELEPFYPWWDERLQTNATISPDGRYAVLRLYESGEAETPKQLAPLFHAVIDLKTGVVLEDRFLMQEAGAGSWVSPREYRYFDYLGHRTVVTLSKEGDLSITTDELTPPEGHRGGFRPIGWYRGDPVFESVAEGDSRAIRRIAVGTTTFTPNWLSFEPVQVGDCVVGWRGPMKTTQRYLINVHTLDGRLLGETELTRKPVSILPWPLVEPGAADVFDALLVNDRGIARFRIDTDGNLTIDPIRIRAGLPAYSLGGNKP